MNLKTTFAAVSLTLLSAAFAKAQEIEVTFPTGKTAKFDCGLLHVENGQIWLTEEAIMSLDRSYGGVNIKAEGLTSKSELSSDARTRGQQLSANQYLFTVHLARQHGNCVAGIAKYEKSKGLNVDKIYGEGWENKTDCILINVRNSCIAAGIK